jgi:hypothetical protein
VKASWLINTGGIQEDDSSGVMPMKNNWQRLVGSKAGQNEGREMCRLVLVFYAQFPIGFYLRIRFPFCNNLTAHML